MSHSSGCKFDILVSRDANIQLLNDHIDSLKDEVEYHKADAKKWALQALRFDKWQPIETAPKDGTRILVTGGTFRREDEDEKRPAWTAIVWWDSDQRVWWGGYLAQDVGVWYEPTHWMPLPEPPLAKPDEIG